MNAKAWVNTNSVAPINSAATMFGILYKLDIFGVVSPPYLAVLQDIRAFNKKYGDDEEAN